MFENFVEQLSASVDAADLCEAMASAAAGFDFPLFAYFTYPSASGDAPQLISNYPSSWTSRYLQQRYHSLDPVILRGLRAARLGYIRLGCGSRSARSAEFAATNSRECG
nr:autoinducer binding domain-containing protein [Mesorhizobium sp. LSHC416B00]